MKYEHDFYLNPQGKTQYNKTCLTCRKECKQSFRAILHCCPSYEPNAPPALNQNDPRKDK